MIRRLLLLALVLLAMCAPIKRAATPEPPVFTKTFHADTAFTPVERERIERAVRDWSEFSGGRVQLVVVYDLDFGSAANIHSHAFDPLLVRVESWMTPVQQFPEPARTTVLGWCEHKWVEKRIYLVVDRLSTPAAVEWVAAHEFGHALDLRAPGCPSCWHASEYESVMYPNYHGQDHFSDEDRRMCVLARLCS